MSVKERIERKLQHAFLPEKLEVIDQSEAHAGHFFERSSPERQGETHFYVFIVAPSFARMTRIERHRAVYDVLFQEIHESVHALALRVLSPDEV